MKPRREQRGSVLVQAALLLVGMLGVAALIVDIGIVRATQGSMVVAADAAALEGLRQREAGPVARRNAATRAALAVFDNGGDGVLLGAGPQLGTGTDAAVSSAGGLLTNDGPYVPVLESNLQNLQHGDLVAGTFTRNPGVRDWHREQADYTRPFDFAVASEVSAPGAPAFLARIRRTNDVLGLDDQEGVSSSGSALPFLFGFGTGIGATDPEAYDPRRDGLTVRATSIADARTAVAAGLSSPGTAGVLMLGRTDVSLPGLQPDFRVLAMEDEDWLDVPPGDSVSLVVDQSGQISGAARAAGITLDGYAQPVPFADSLVRIGREALPTGSTEPVLLAPTLDGMLGTQYLALYSVDTGVPVITGLAALNVVAATRDPIAGVVTTWTLTGSKLGSMIAPENASAVPSLAFDPSGINRGELLAPVLAR